MNANTERAIDEFVRGQNEDRKRKGLEEMVKDINKTIERTNKTLATFTVNPGKK